MPLLAATTELDAINEMLMSIGQAPVSSLLVGNIKDVNIARSLLTSVTRAVLLYGFAFNTDDIYTITPDVDGLLTVPSGILRIDAADRYANLLVRRHPDGALAIWNADDQTWEFDEAVDFKIVWGFTYDDLPPSAQNYVTLSAARKFQARTIGSPQLDGFNAEDEQKAWIMLLRDERAVRDTNLFRSNPALNGASRQY